MPIQMTDLNRAVRAKLRSCVESVVDGRFHGPYTPACDGTRSLLQALAFGTWCGMVRNLLEEPLIYSGRSRLQGEMCSFKAQVAGNSCSIAKICNDEAEPSSPKMHVHE